jgi:hypothetical protein
MRIGLHPDPVLRNEHVNPSAIAIFPMKIVHVGNVCFTWATGNAPLLNGKVSMDGWCNQWTPPTIGRTPTQLPEIRRSVMGRPKTNGG